MRVFTWFLAALAIAGVSLLYVLSGPSSDDASPEPDGKAEAGQTRSRDLLTLPLRSFAINLDPATMADVESRKIATLLYAGLVAVDQDGSVSPRVAASWEQVDARTWDFRLQPGLTFPDGSPLTSAQVIESLCASMQPDHIQSWSLASIARRKEASGPEVECTGLAAPEAHTVRITQQTPTPWLLEALAGPGGWIVDVSAAKGPYGVRPGVGPYVVQAVTPDERVTLVAREHGAVVPQARSIEFRHLPDAQLLVSRYRSGDLDLVEVESPQLLELLTNKRGVLDVRGRIVRHSVDRVRVVVFNLGRLSSMGLSERKAHDLVHAYSRAIDRARVAGITNGLAEPLESPFPPFSRTPDAVGRPATAIDDPLQLTLITENDPYSDLLAAHLPERVGAARITYQTMEKSLLLDALLEGKYDIALLKIEATHRTPIFWAAFFTPGNPYTAFGREIDGVGELDLATDDGLRDAATLIGERGNWVGVLREVGSVLMSPRITGLRFTGSGQLSLETIGPAP